MSNGVDNYIEPGLINSFTVSIFFQLGLSLCAKHRETNSFMQYISISLKNNHWKWFACVCVWVVAAATAAFSWRRITNLCIKSFNISIPFGNMSSHTYKNHFCFFSLFHIQFAIYSYDRERVVCYYASVCFI